jgi:AraC-like DNA-binding protein
MSAPVSEAHLIRSFRAVFREKPHRYLQRRRVERSMFLLRETDRSVTEICFDVGFASLGTFSRTFREIVGESPTAYRAGHEPMVAPNCFQLAVTRPVQTAGAAQQEPPGRAWAAESRVSIQESASAVENSATGPPITSCPAAASCAREWRRTILRMVLRTVRVHPLHSVAV